jgi:phage terminase small subunit
VKLTKKQELFVLEYLKDLNATRSAIAAGYKPKSAYSMGSQLLKNINVATALSKRLGKHTAKLELTAERVLDGLERLAFFDMRKFYREDGSLKAIPELDEETAFALCGMEVEEAYEHFGKGQAKPTGQIKKIKVADRGQNLERLGRYFKLFTDKVEHSGEISLAERIAAGRQRVAEKRTT